MGIFQPIGNLGITACQEPQLDGSLYGAIKAVGLTSNLQVCLDAADSLSYASGQPWLDRSGNGFDFNRGTGSGADAADPTFNGTAGAKSLSEYFSFDGGDWFTYDSANEAWMDRLHKDNALYTITEWWYPSNVATQQTLFSTFGLSASGTGARLLISAAGQLNVQVKNAGSNALNQGTILAPNVNAWNFCGLSVDEAAGAGARIMELNGATATGNATYTSPSAGAADGCTIAAGVGGLVPFVSGSRLGGVAIWEGVALTAAQMQAVFDATRGRYGV